MLGQTANTIGEDQKNFVKEEGVNIDSKGQQSPVKNTLYSKPVSRKSVSKPYSTVGAIPKTKPIKFVPPFNLYYYRDFIWKVAFSNELIVESPQ